MKIIQALSLIMAEVGAVAKDKVNPQQNYKFRGIDDIYMAVQKLFAKHGVVVIPSVTNNIRGTVQTKSGNTMNVVVLTVKHEFYAGDGSKVEAVTIGEAQDSGDKASNKAMSAALKYALIEVLCIPTGEKIDTEHDTPDYQQPRSRTAAAPKQQPKPAAPVTPPPAPEPLGEEVPVTERVGFVKKVAKAHNGIGIQIDDGTWLKTENNKHVALAKSVEGKNERVILEVRGNTLVSIEKEG